MSTPTSAVQSSSSEAVSGRLYRKRYDCAIFHAHPLLAQLLYTSLTEQHGLSVYLNAFAENKAEAPESIIDSTRLAILIVSDPSTQRDFAARLARSQALPLLFLFNCSRDTLGCDPAYEHLMSCAVQLSRDVNLASCVDAMATRAARLHSLEYAPPQPPSSQNNSVWLTDDMIVLALQHFVPSSTRGRNCAIVEPATVAVLATDPAMAPGLTLAAQVNATRDFFKRGVTTSVLLPLNIDNQHWTLLRVSRDTADSKCWRAVLFDSLPPPSAPRCHQVAQQLLVGLAAVIESVEGTPPANWYSGRDVPLVAAPVSLRQTTGNDCGVFVVDWIRSMAQGDGRTATAQSQDDIDLLRTEILELSSINESAQHGRARANWLFQRSAKTLPTVLLLQHRPLVAAANALVVSTASCIALVGPGGSGKSTAAALLARLVARTAPHSESFASDLSTSDLPTARLLERFSSSIDANHHENTHTPVWLEFALSDTTGIAQAQQLLATLTGRDVRSVADLTTPEALQKALASYACPSSSSSSNSSTSTSSLSSLCRLVVLDNVSSAAQLAPFLALPSNLVLLITTRSLAHLCDIRPTPILVDFATVDPAFAPAFLSAACPCDLSPSVALQVSTRTQHNLLLLSVVAATCAHATNPLEALVGFATTEEDEEAHGEDGRDNDTYLLSKALEELSQHSRTRTVKFLQVLACFPAQCRIPCDIYTAVLVHLGWTSTTSVDSCCTLAARCAFVQRSLNGDVWMHENTSRHLRASTDHPEQFQATFVAALRTILREKSRDLSVSDTIRMSTYLASLGVQDHDSVAHNPAASADLQRLNEALGKFALDALPTVLERGSLGVGIECLAVAVRHLSKAFSTTLVDAPQGATASEVPDSVVRLFDMLSPDTPINEETFVALVRATPPEELFGKTQPPYRPRYGVTVSTVWADSRPEAFGLTHLACLRGTTAMVRALVEAASAANASLTTFAEGSATQRTELFLATQVGNIEAVRLLINAGCRDNRVASCGTAFGAQSLKLDDAALSDPSLSGTRERLSEIPGGAEYERVHKEVVGPGQLSWAYLHCIHMAIANDAPDMVRLLLDRGVANTSYASLNVGWIDMAIQHRSEACLIAILVHIFDRPAPHDTATVVVQSHRYIRRELPDAALAWFDHWLAHSYAQTSATGANRRRLASLYEDALAYEEAERQRQAAAALQRGGFPVSIRTLTGKTITVVCEPGKTVAHLQSLISDREGIPCKDQRLVFNGKHLVENVALDVYGIVEGSTDAKSRCVMLVLRMRGGST